MDFTRQSPRAVQAHFTSLARGGRTCIDRHVGSPTACRISPKGADLAESHGYPEGIPAIIYGMKPPAPASQ